MLNISNITMDSDNQRWPGFYSMRCLGDTVMSVRFISLNKIVWC